MSGRLFGVLVTFRRPDDLARTLRVIAEQDRPLDLLWVVDNDPEESARTIVDAHMPPAIYAATGANLGPAGGIAIGMAAVIDHLDGDLGSDDWLVLFDDDDPPVRESQLGELESLAHLAHHDDPLVAGVAITGGRFDWRRGRMDRLGDDELTGRGRVEVDYLGGNQLPTYHLATVAEVGHFVQELFWGFDDLEFGLRLRAQGRHLVIDGNAAMDARSYWGRSGASEPPSEPVAWRRYYTTRNLIWVLLQHHRRFAALRGGLRSGLVGPARWVIRRPSDWRVLAMGCRGMMDGFRGRLGRRVEPGVKPLRR